MCVCVCVYIYVCVCGGVCVCVFVSMVAAPDCGFTQNSQAVCMCVHVCRERHPFFKYKNNFKRIRSLKFRPTFSTIRKHMNMRWYVCDHFNRFFFDKVKNSAEASNPNILVLIF